MPGKQTLAYTTLLISFTLLHAQELHSPTPQQTAACVGLLNDVWNLGLEDQMIQGLCTGSIDGSSGDGGCQDSRYHPAGGHCSSAAVSLNGMLLVSSYHINGESPDVDPWHEMLTERGVLFATQVPIYMENLKLPPGTYRLYAASTGGAWMLSIYPISLDSVGEKTQPSIGSVRMTSAASSVQPHIVPSLILARFPTMAQLQFVWQDTKLFVNLGPVPQGGGMEAREPPAKSE